MGLLDKDGLVQNINMHKKDDSDEESDEESSSEEEQKFSEKKKKKEKGKFRVNTSYCRSELELL